jgi:hypothetical protein
MATKKEIKKHLEIALKEIGQIEPWFDKDVDAWVFEHKAYPVGYSGDSKDEVIDNYPRYLEEFIKQRLNHNLAPSVEKKTKGRGGKREGSGRPKGTKKTPTKRVTLPKKIAEWIVEPSSQRTVLQLIAKSHH